MPASPATLRVRITSRTVEATEVCAFDLGPVDGSTLPPFSAGSHIDVHLPASSAGPGSGSLVRHYSLCNDPAERGRYQIAVLLDAHTRGGSRAMHALQVGDMLTISAPKNHFALAPDAARSLLFAGGIGVTPILCMAQELASAGSSFEMHYCSRSRERTAFFDRIVQAPFADQVHFHFDDGDAAQKLELAALLAAPLRGTHLYVCGPKGFIDAVIDGARRAGWPQDHLHCEFFSAEPARSETDSSFAVRLASSGRLIKVAADRTIVEALAEAGIEVPTACEQGVCGTCLTTVLEGEPDHRDMVLTPAEQAANDQMLLCCSRSRTPLLVLDL